MRVIGAAIVSLALASAASGAAWPCSAHGNGAGKAGAIATAPAPSVGTITGTVTKTVPLSWTAVSGATTYTVRRYDTVLGTSVPIGGTCSGSVGGTSCADTNVPILSTWRYTVQGIHGTWTGTEGPGTTVST